MHAKWAATGKSELFVDTKTLPITKKQVLPISEQEEFESRNAWKVVTAALKNQDVIEATAAKYAIEQNQRNLAKDREEKSIKWKNRVSFVWIVVSYDKLKLFLFFCSLSTGFSLFC